MIAHPKRVSAGDPSRPQHVADCRDSDVHCGQLLANQKVMPESYFSVFDHDTVNGSTNTVLPVT